MQSLFALFLFTELKFWSRIGVDPNWPLKKTAAGNKLIVMCADAFSKWPEAAPLDDRAAERITSFFLAFFVLYFSAAMQSALVFIEP